MSAFEAGVAWACYSVVLFFVLASAIKIRKYANVPLGVRWELYPVPSEAQRGHGGSFLEETEWWAKPGSGSRVAELEELLVEMLFIKRLYQNKRGVWYFSFLFHGGIYLILGWFVLVLAGGFTQLFFYPVSLAAWTAYPVLFSEALFYLTLGFGYVGVAAAAVGAVGLFVHRYLDTRTRDISAPVDYLNLVFAFAVIVSGAVALTVDSSFNVARSVMAYLLSGAGTIVGFPSVYSSVLSSASAPQIVVQVTLLLAFLVYLPFTRLMHFFGKYFTYHKVLWDSKPSMISGSYDKRIGVEVGTNLAMRVPWSAPHVKEGAQWKEVAKNAED